MVLESKLGVCACQASALPVFYPSAFSESHLELWTVLAIGSSAGAGSGEFHVYRHLRRREYQRQDYMDAMAEKVREPRNLVTVGQAWHCTPFALEE